MKNYKPQTSAEFEAKEKALDASISHLKSLASLIAHLMVLVACICFVGGLQYWLGGPLLGWLCFGGVLAGVMLWFCGKGSEEERF